MELGAAWGQRLEENPGKSTEVPPVDEQDVAQGAVNRAKEGASLSRTFFRRELRTRLVEAVIAPEVVAGHGAKVLLEGTHPLLPLGGRSR
jgi:hypothetical protein